MRLKHKVEMMKQTAMELPRRRFPIISIVAVIDIDVNSDSSSTLECELTTL